MPPKKKNYGGSTRGRTRVQRRVQVQVQPINEEINEERLQRNPRGPRGPRGPTGPTGPRGRRNQPNNENNENNDQEISQERNPRDPGGPGGPTGPRGRRRNQPNNDNDNNNNENIDQLIPQIRNELLNYNNQLNNINNQPDNNLIYYARLFLSNSNSFYDRYRNEFSILNTAAQQIINQSSSSSSSSQSRQQSLPSSSLSSQSRQQLQALSLPSSSLSSQSRQQLQALSLPSSSLSSSIASSSKTKSSETNSNSYDETYEIDTICADQFKQILEVQKSATEAKKKNDLKKLLNKLIKYCSKYIKNKHVFNDQKKDNAKTKLKDYYTVNGDIILNITNRNNILKELFIKFQDQKILKKFLKVRTHQYYSLGESSSGLKINFLEDIVLATDLGGPQSEFIDLLTQKINNIEDNIFIKLGDNDVYIPNINLTLDEAKNILGDSLKKLEDFFYFIGQMVFFLLKAKSGLKIKLARTLLFRMVTKYNDRTFHTDKYKKLQHQYYYHYTLDKDNFKTLEYFYKSSLEDISEELVENFETEEDLYKFMIETAHTGSYFDNDIIKSFIAGFHSVSKNLYNYFIENKISVIELNKMLFLTELTIDRIRNILIPKVKERLDQPLPNQLKAFIEILNDNVEFPQQFIDSEKSKQENENKIYPKNHIEFVEFLLKYWTGSSILYETDNYKLFATLQDYQLTASTCFNQLTIGPLTGLDLEQTKKTLYELLIIESIEHGFTDN